jgi:hypothetical protein
MKSNGFYEFGRCFNRAAMRPPYKFIKKKLGSIWHGTEEALPVVLYSLSQVCYFEELMSFWLVGKAVSNGTGLLLFEVRFHIVSRELFGWSGILDLLRVSNDLARI